MPTSDQGGVEPLHVVAVWVIHEDFIADNRHWQQKSRANADTQRKGA